MQDIRYAKANKTDTSYLFRIDSKTIEQWQDAGLKTDSEGKFLLSDVIAWLKDKHRKELQERPDVTSLDSLQVCILFGISRQTIFHWRKAGLKQNEKGKYDLREVCLFLRDFYHRSAEAKLQRHSRAQIKKINRNAAQLKKYLSS